ncbi:hypothetical protein PENTCL1PPCAC_2859, partial [Pristionchus entomophagus]
SQKLTNSTKLQMSETCAPSVAGTTVKLASSLSSIDHERSVKEEPIEEENEEEPICSVDACQQRSKKDDACLDTNFPVAMEMILACKKDVHDQNDVIQRYVEGHHLDGRAQRKRSLRSQKRVPVKEWTRSLPFKVCSRHLNKDGDLINLPEEKEIQPLWNNMVDLVRRESLFHMYGVNWKVDFPSGDQNDEMLASIRRRFTCDIPGCSSNTYRVGKARFYPVPINEVLRGEWEGAISTALDRPFILPEMGLICEKHFHNGGRNEEGITTELPVVFGPCIRAALQKQKVQNRLISPTSQMDTTQVHYPNQPTKQERQTKHSFEVVEDEVVSKAVEEILQQCKEAEAQGMAKAVDRQMRYPEAKRNCIVRCCPITSKARKRDNSEYQMFELPGGFLGDLWIKALANADIRFKLRARDLPIVCERHFSPNNSPNVVTMAIPDLHLNPSEALMSRTDSANYEIKQDEPCICCQDVETCHEILRRFNSKMNTLMQHVNMLCVLEGVKEVIPRRFDDTEDDTELYGDPEKVAALAGVRAASMFVSEAKREVAAMNKTLDFMQQKSYDQPRRQCALFTCNSKRRYRYVDAKTFERDIKSGALSLKSEADRQEIRRQLTKVARVSLCENHWTDHIDNISVDSLYDDDDEDVRRLKEALAIPVDFQPSYGKRRRIGGMEDEEDEEEGEGGSGMVQVEVHDDEEEDERLLSNNELLQRLLGGAIPGQVTGEIGDNGEVYEGGEEEAEMDQLHTEEARTEDEGEEMEEDYEQELTDEDPPELD